LSKLDLKKELKHLYAANAKRYSIVEVPPLNYLMIDGHGDPTRNPEYQKACEALYSMSYTLKFRHKALGNDYGVMPLEGLWWMENMADFSLGSKDRWDWTMMIMQPKAITTEQLQEACCDVARKKNLSLPPSLRLEPYSEGLSVQILYVGAYADEGPVIARMHAFARDSGYRLQGKHHEIYLGDPRKTAPEKLKTILRQPIARESRSATAGQAP
jgi:hypothetical protein